MAAATPRHFVSMRDLSATQISELLDQAVRMKSYAADIARNPPLKGRTLAMIFQKPSLRTRVSFEAGIARLGGRAIHLGPSDIQLGQRESVEDIALVLSRYADLIMARVFSHDVVVSLARHATVPVINGLSDLEHPCQILADLLTVRERLGRLSGVRGAWIGDGNNVAHSLMLAAAALGMHLRVGCPVGYEPDAALTRESMEAAARSGGSVQIVHDPLEAAAAAEFVYTDVWTSMGQETESAQRREKFRGFQINRELMSRAAAHCVILHCLPAHYGEEIDYETSRTPNSAIFDQAENRMHAQNALMVLLAG